MTHIKHQRVRQGCVPGPFGETAKEFSSLASSKFRFIQQFRFGKTYGWTEVFFPLLNFVPCSGIHTAQGWGLCQ